MCLVDRLLGGVDDVDCLRLISDIRVTPRRPSICTASSWRVPTSWMSSQRSNWRFHLTDWLLIYDPHTLSCAEKSSER